MGTTIKRIYTGLPEYLINEVLWVERNYRINELSHQPGGFDVVIEYKSGNVLGYDWIKRPPQYIDKIIKNDALQNGITDFESFDESQQLLLAKRLINAAYARKYANEEDFNNVAFQQVWDSSSSEITLTESLAKFEIENLNNCVIKLSVTKITKSKLGDYFEAMCDEVCKHNLLGRRVYCKFHLMKSIDYEFSVDIDYVKRVVTKLGRQVWVLQ